MGRVIKNSLGTYMIQPALRCPICRCWTWPSQLDPVEGEDEEERPVVEIGIVRCGGRHGLPRACHDIARQLSDPGVGPSRAALLDVLRKLRGRLRATLVKVEALLRVFGTDEDRRESWATVTQTMSMFPAPMKATTPTQGQLGRPGWASTTSTLAEGFGR